MWVCPRVEYPNPVVYHCLPNKIAIWGLPWYTPVLDKPLCQELLTLVEACSWHQWPLDTEEASVSSVKSPDTKKEWLESVRSFCPSSEPYPLFISSFWTENAHTVVVF